MVIDVLGENFYITGGRPFINAISDAWGNDVTNHPTAFFFPSLPIIPSL
jgi:hypothetical protein